MLKITFLLLSIIGSALANEKNPIVESKNGRVKGKLDSSYSGKTYYSFHAIPYAKSPLGDLRFTVSVPLSNMAIPFNN